MKKKISFFVVVVSLAAFIPSVGAADSCVPANSKQDKYSAKLAKKGLAREAKAEKILADFEKSSEKAAARAEKASSADPSSKLDKAKLDLSAIPLLALGKAQCAVIIPGDKKIGIAGYGADYGAGISLCKDSSGNFSNPSFVKIRGGSLGPQIGAKSTDQVLLFMRSDSEKLLQKPSLKLGGDVAVAAGPVGRDASAAGDVDLNMGDGVLSYSHSKGAYIGATLDGAVLQPDTKMNDAVAGKKVKEGFFEKIEQAIAGVFHNTDPASSNGSCEASIGAASAASDMNAAVNPPAIVPQAAVASNAAADQQPVMALDPLAQAAFGASNAAAAQAPAAAAAAPAAAQADAVN